MEPGLRAMAQRLVNAENGFVQTLMERGKISKVDAEKVFVLYKKLKLVKLHAANGEYKVKHGGYLDEAVIVRALNTL